MEKYSEGSNILFREYEVYSKSLKICVAFFAIHDGSSIW